MPEWPLVGEQVDLAREVESLRADLGYERDTNLLMLESLADLQLAAEDKGWISAEMQAERDFSTEGRKRIAINCELVAAANPLAKRAVQLRTGYIWGEGVSISCAQDEVEGGGDPQDVNAILQAFVDEPRNRNALFGQAAHEDIEHRCATAGEIFYCLPTNRLTGQVTVRKIEPDEITEIITNPEDRDEDWYYKRVYTRRALGPTDRWAQKTITVYYPALGYNPRGTDRLPKIGDAEVLWDQPVRAVILNRPTSRSQRGIGDLYSVLPWIRASKEIMEAWVLLFKALTRYAYQVKTRGDRTQDTARRMRAANDAAGPAGNAGGAGATYVGGNDTHLEAVSKTGATIDNDAAKPIVQLISAGVGIPITMLLGDPGVTGARAVAETLDAPTKIVMGARRGVHREALLDICDYVINWAIKVGKLKGSITYEGTREIGTLAGEQDRTVLIDFPPFESEDVKAAVEAIETAASLGVMPDALLLQLILTALKVPDADKIIEANTDDDGNWLDIDAQAQDRQARQGGGEQDREVPDAGDGADVPAGRAGEDPAVPNGRPGNS